MGKRPGMKVGDQEHTIRGEMLQVGDRAPNFTLIARDLSEKTLDDYAGKVKILSVVPSLDTSVCSEQAKRFEREAMALDGHVVILTISSDMPFTQKRWGEEMGIEKTDLLSTRLYRE